MGYGAGGSNTPNLEQLLQLGIRTAREGNRQSARVIFQQVLDADKRNERAWLWMASVAEDDMDRRRYLETVLRLNPKNEKAKQYLASMEKRSASTENRTLVRGLIILAILVVLVILVIIAAVLLSRPS